MALEEVEQQDGTRCQAGIANPTRDEDALILFDAFLSGHCTQHRMAGPGQRARQNRTGQAGAPRLEIQALRQAPEEVFSALGHVLRNSVSEEQPNADGRVREANPDPTPNP
jgi:hypothetical protein